MMKKFNIKSAIAAACIATFSVTTHATNEQTSSIWKVSKGDDVVYIGGTIHILPITEFPLPTQFTEVYKQTDSLVFETKLPEPTDLQAQQAMVAAMSYPEGKSLHDVLSDETINELDEYLSGFGVSFEQFASFKPGLITVFISAMEAQRQQMAGEGVDAYFSQMGKKDNREMQYLESIEQQTAILANLWEGEEELIVKLTLDELANTKTYLKALITAWRSGDEVAMNTLAVEKLKEYSETAHHSLFIKRNQNWVPQIEAMFGDTDKEFVLVGAGHLVGDNSVIELLENKGYSVNKI